MCVGSESKGESKVGGRRASRRREVGRAVVTRPLGSVRFWRGSDSVWLGLESERASEECVGHVGASCEHAGRGYVSGHVEV